MKKNLLLLTTFTAMVLLANAQQSRKLLLLEHFTNSRCGICASKNPAFYATISKYSKDIVHLSIHPSVPYSSCIFYQANTADNDSRTNYYGVFSTPTVVLNGTVLSPGTPLLPEKTITDNLNKTSPVAVAVTETGGTKRTAKVTVTVTGSIAPGTPLRLYAAVAEKTINTTTPNGETVHYDVMRKFLPTVQGQDITNSLGSGKAEFTLTYDVQSGWKESEIYLIAWVQNSNTKEVLNAGSRFTTTTTSTTAPDAPAAFEVAPNPTSGVIRINWNHEGVTPDRLTVLNSAGQAVFNTTLESGNALSGYAVDLGGQAPGVYVVRIQASNQTYVQKVLLR